MGLAGLRGGVAEILLVDGIGEAAQLVEDAGQKLAYFGGMAAPLAESGKIGLVEHGAQGLGVLGFTGGAPAGFAREVRGMVRQGLGLEGKGTGIGFVGEQQI